MLGRRVGNLEIQVFFSYSEDQCKYKIFVYVRIIKEYCVIYKKFYQKVFFEFSRFRFFCCIQCDLQISSISIFYYRIFQKLEFEVLFYIYRSFSYISIVVFENFGFVGFFLVCLGLRRYSIRNLIWGFSVKGSDGGKQVGQVFISDNQFYQEEWERGVKVGCLVQVRGLQDERRCRLGDRRQWLFLSFREWK